MFMYAQIKKVKGEEIKTIEEVIPGTQSAERQEDARASQPAITLAIGCTQIAQDKKRKKLDTRAKRVMHGLCDMPGAEGKNETSRRRTDCAASQVAAEIKSTHACQWKGS